MSLTSGTCSRRVNRARGGRGDIACKAFACSRSCRRLLLVYLLFVSSPRVFVFLMRGAMARRRAWLLLLPCFVCVLLRLCPAAGRGLPVSPAPGGPSPAPGFVLGAAALAQAGEPSADVLSLLAAEQLPEEMLQDEGSRPEPHGPRSSPPRKADKKGRKCLKKRGRGGAPAPPEPWVADGVPRPTPAPRVLEPAGAPLRRQRPPVISREPLPLAGEELPQEMREDGGVTGGGPQEPGAVRSRASESEALVPPLQELLPAEMMMPAGPVSTERPRAEPAPRPPGLGQGASVKRRGPLAEWAAPRHGFPVSPPALDLGEDLDISKLPRPPLAPDPAQPPERCPLAQHELLPPPPSHPAGCEIPSEQQVRCGLPDTSPAACQARGCCVDNTTSGCYYPLNVCTRDGHFIFTVHRHDTVPDTDPRGLVAGPSGCAPALATPHYAIFAIGLQLCGVRSSVEGNATVYAVEVRGTRLATAQVAYGQISRDVPFSMQVRCRLVPGSFSSRGFLVRDLPPPVASAAGQLRLELRVARDGCYRSYFPQAALPLQLRLKAPLFLEVRLVLPPDPSLVLLVHYCVAYPRSAQAAWVLIYDGCPNEVDPDSVDIKVQPADHPRHYRRFTVHTFQFVNPNTGRYLGEEVYIMCVTEVCSPAVQSCDPKCFDPKTMRMQLPGSKPVPGDIAVQQGPFLMPKAWPPK